MNKHDPAKGREASLFKSNRSQAVRIPKELAFPEGVKKVRIARDGDRLILEAVDKRPGSWDEFFANGPFLDDDFADDVRDTPPRDVEPL